MHECSAEWMLTWLYCDYFESGLWESWHGIWFTALEQFDCIKVTPDFNLVFKFSKLRRTPNVTASSKTTYTLIMQRFFPFSLSLSLSTHIHTPSHAYRHDALFILWNQSHRRRYYHCQTMHWHVPVRFVYYPQFVMESSHLFKSIICSVCSVVTALSASIRRVFSSRIIAFPPFPWSNHSIHGQKLRFGRCCLLVSWLLILSYPCI